MKKKISMILILILSLVYFISQFYRSSLGVMTNDLMSDFDISHEAMGRLGGIFFLSFAMAQIPLGIFLDKFNTVLVILVMLAITFVGTIIFIIANSFGGLFLGRALQGFGCAACFMGALVLISRLTSKEFFASYAGTVMALGGFGGLLATAPLAYSISIFGWKYTFFLSTLLIIISMFLIWFYFIFKAKNINYSKKINYKLDNSFEVLKSILKNKNFLLMLPMSMFGYASFATLISLWAAPYLKDVYNLDLILIGYLLMSMALSWILGSYIMGKSERYFKTKKGIVVFGSSMMIITLLILASNYDFNIYSIFLIFSFYGFNGAFTVILLSHYTSLFPSYIVGRVLTTANLFNFLGVFLLQWLTGFMIDIFSGNVGIVVKSSYSAAFYIISILLLLSLISYIFTKDINIRDKE